LMKYAIGLMRKQHRFCCRGLAYCWLFRTFLIL